MSGSPTLFEARSTPLQSLGGTGFRVVAGILVACAGVVALKTAEARKTNMEEVSALA